MRFAAAVIAIFGATIGGCSGHHDNPPATLAEAMGPPFSGSYDQSADMYTVTLPTEQDDTEYVSDMATLAKRFAQAIQANAPDIHADRGEIAILYLRPDLDRLGSPDAHSFAWANFKVSDLAAAHTDRLGAYGVLDLVAEMHPVLPWQLVIGKWCQEHDRAPNFCLETKLALGDGVPWNGPE